MTKIIYVSIVGLNNGGAGFYSAGLHTQQAHSTTPNTLSHGKYFLEHQRLYKKLN